jgi:flagellar FliL protein
MAITDTKPPVGGEASPQKSKRPLLLGLVLALALGGAGFYSAYSGLLPVGGDVTVGEAESRPERDDEAMQPVAFVPVDPIVVSLGAPGQGRHLRFRAQLEVVPGREAEVAALMPRVLDVLNGYLRAVPAEELEAPAALVRLRAQMLRRLQLVAGEGRIRDLLVTEFVLN